MKFFTFESWCKGQDDESKASLYWEYLNSIKDELIPTIKDFVFNHNLHDSKVNKIESNNCGITMTLIGWDTNFEKRRKYILKFTDVEYYNYIGNQDESLPGPGGFGEIGYTEYEKINNVFSEYRIIFSTGIELTVGFNNFEFDFINL